MVVSKRNETERVESPFGFVQISCIWDGPARLGECPLWDPVQQRLFWIDSLGKKIWSINANGSDARSWNMPDVIGSIGLCRDDRLIAGFGRGFGLVSLSEGNASVEWLGDPDPEQRDTRLNDGKVDQHGRFWCGTMNVDFKRTNAALFILNPDGTWEKVDGGFTVSNGVAFSPDGTTAYFSDSRVDRSYRYALDADTGQVKGRETFLDTSAYDGRVDGATVDASGRYWAALFGGSAVACFSPEGKLLHKIEMPVSHPTMCSFGGPNLDILYVTSATFQMDEEGLKREPLAGSLFAIRGLGVKGLEEPRFGLPVR